MKIRSTKLRKKIKDIRARNERIMAIENRKNTLIRKTCQEFGFTLYEFGILLRLAD